MDTEVAHTHHGISPGHRKEGNRAFCDHVENLAGAVLSGVSQAETTTPRELTHVWNRPLPVALVAFPWCPPALSIFPHVASFSRLSAPSCQSSIRDVGLGGALGLPSPGFPTRRGLPGPSPAASPAQEWQGPHYIYASSSSCMPLKQRG